MYLFKFEACNVKEAEYFRMYAHVLIRGSAVITNNPIVIQMLDARGRTTSQINDSDIGMWEVFNV